MRRYPYFTVPEGKQFVLLKWDASKGWNHQTPNQKYMPIEIGLTVDDAPLLGLTYVEQWEQELDWQEYPVEVPDKCIVLNAGETLKVTSKHDYEVQFSAVYGYFCDAE